MPEMKVKLKGWHALVALAAVALLVIVRIVSFDGETDDPALKNVLEVQLMSDYYPDEAERLKAAVASGDAQAIARAAKSVTTTKATIESVRTSYPLLDFSAPKTVIVKVTYSLADESGTRETRTRYYRFQYGGVANKWRYEYETSNWAYYLNLL